MAINKDIIIYDLETSFNLQAMWSMYQDGAQPAAIIEERFIICAAWKYYGDTKVHCIEPTKSELRKRSDKRVCAKLKKVLSKAAFLVAHNGDRFDLPMLNGRMVINGLAPLPMIQQIDTLKIARRHFKFNCNKLDYLGTILGVGNKVATGGFDLWKKVVLDQDPKAMEKMATYNKQDVRLLEQVYDKLRPYAHGHPNVNLLGDLDSYRCPICGSEDIGTNGVRLTKTQKYTRYLCKGCGSSFRGRKSLIAPDQRKHILTT